MRRPIWELVAKEQVLVLRMVDLPYLIQLRPWGRL